MNKNVKKYVVYTYLMFFVFIGIIGLVMYIFNMKVLGAVLQTVSAWTPTFVLFLMFKKIYLGEKRLQFIRKQFSEKIKPTVLFAAIGLPLVIFIGTLISASLIYEKPFYELMIVSPLVLLSTLPYQLSSGPLGEELGWRAFLLPEMQKKHSILKSGFLVGLIWGFWHFLLWLTTGYGWPELLIYIIAFMVCIVCCSIIIAILYNKCKNILIAIIVHLLNNYLLGLFTFDLIPCITIFAIFYLIITCILIFINKKTLKKETAT